MAGYTYSMTTTQNTDRIWTIYRCGADGARSTSGNLTAAEASAERDRQSQALPAHSRAWIEMRRNG